MKITVTIEVDTDTKRAAVKIGDRPAQVWKDCDFHFGKTSDNDGQTWTNERSLTLYGTVVRE